jgi:hypothetical protein
MVTKVHEAYRNYSPPKWVRPTVDALLSAVPAAYLSSLESIVLTDGASVGIGKTHRIKGRKFNLRDCKGFYRRAHGGAGASIDLVVDNVLDGYPRFFFGFVPFREQVIAGVLFHEIGHHLDATIGAGAATGEATAEDWGRRLSGSYFQRRYRWFRPLARILLPLVRRLRNRRIMQRRDQ